MYYSLRALRIIPIIAGIVYLYWLKQRVSTCSFGLLLEHQVVLRAGEALLTLSLGYTPATVYRGDRSSALFRGVAKGCKAHATTVSVTIRPSTLSLRR